MPTALKRITIIFLITQLLSSCGSGLKVEKESFVPLSHKFKGVFLNKPYHSKGKNPHPPTLLDRFELYPEPISPDTIYISFNQNENLEVSYRSLGGTNTEIFQGKLSPRGYYELYLRRDKKEIPPVVPFIYGSRDIDRIRIALTQNGDLIIDNKWAHDANIFLFAGGGKGRNQDFFEALN
jgi:hypothetical protein